MLINLPCSRHKENGENYVSQNEEAKSTYQRQLEDAQDEADEYHSHIYRLGYNTALYNIFRKEPKLIHAVEALNIVTDEGSPIDVDWR